MQVDEETYSKKTLDAMILQTLWDRVYAMQDVATKQNAIKKLRQSGHYDSLIVHLTKAKKDKVKKILDLTAEIMIAYMN